jgi:cell division protein FtsW
MRATLQTLGHTWQALARPRPTPPGALDLPLAIAVLALAALGLVLVHSAGALLSERRHGDPFHFLERQAMHLMLGVGALFVALLVDPRFWLKIGGVLFLGAVGLLVALALFPGLGPATKGASRWIQLGPFSFQPSELAKVALLFVLARTLGQEAQRVRSFTRGYLPILALTAILVLPVLLQPDFGAAVTLCALALTLLFVAGARLSHLGLTALLLMPIAYWLVDGTPYRRARMLAFLDPFAHRREEGYQIYESMVSFASGGWTGVGLGEGPQKLGFFPEYHNDFILAAAGEELGLLGVLAVIALYSLLLWRGLRIAARAADRSLSLLACGVTALFGIQAVIHMGVVMAVLPTKGLPLPFVSYGGTSLVLSLLLAGVLLQIGREAPPGVPP